MTEPWGQVADEPLMVADPADVPDETTDELVLTVRCPAGRKLLRVYRRASGSDDDPDELVAVWNGPVLFPDQLGTSAGYYVWHRRRHIGHIPQHIVDHDRLTGEPVLGALIGGIITAQSRNDTYHLHTREIEQWCRSGRREVRLRSTDRRRVD